MDSSYRVVLTGASDVGKTTFAKQVCSMYEKEPWCENETVMKKWSDKVRKVVLENMMPLIFEAGEDVLKENEGIRWAMLTRQRAQPLWDRQVVTDLRILWHDPAIQKAFHEKASRLHVMDNLRYFMEEENWIRIASPHYVATRHDVLHARICTFGVEECQLAFPGDINVSMFDFGGRRSERAKDLRGFENVDVLMFFCALDDYDMVLFENRGVSRTLEAQNLFEKLVNYYYFAESDIVLVFSKVDSLRNKLRFVPYRVAGQRNDDFMTPEPSIDHEAALDMAVDAVVAHTVQKFKSQVQDKDRVISHFVVNLMNPEDVMRLLIEVWGVEARAAPKTARILA